MSSHALAIVAVVMGLYAIVACAMAAWVVDRQRRAVYVILCMQLSVIFGVAALYVVGVEVPHVGDVVRPLFLSIFISIGSLALIDWYRNR